MPPLISICLPNLNNRSFLEERIDTILFQSLQDWELVVSDNYSDDGAWEYFQCLAAKDPRVLIQQAPKQGMYANWNNTLRRAKGKYVYIATSDDTMPPECLQELVQALESNPSCDIAHCPLKAIGIHGEDLDLSWYNAASFVTSSGDLVNQKHIRRAPYDGLLHTVGSSVYWSITQLLFRRSLFDKVGLFESQWGSMGDFNWNMRASLIADTVHIPTTWGGWRIHPSQATAHTPKEQFQQRMEQMIDHAVEVSNEKVAGPLKKNLEKWSKYFRERDSWWNGDEGKLQRLAFVTSAIVSGNSVAWDYLRYRLGLGNAWELEAPGIVREWVKQCGIDEPLVPLLPHQ